MGAFGVQKGDSGIFLRGSELAQLQRDLEREFGSVVDDLEEVAVDMMQKIVVPVATRLCPKDTGYLRESVYVTSERSARMRVRVILGYSADYAIYVHENPDARHKAPTRWKWAEEALVTTADRYLAAVARGVKARQR